MFRVWRIHYSDGEIIELRRVRRPSRLARAMMTEAQTSFVIELYRLCEV